MPRINPEHARRGAAAEADFKRWLDYSGVPYVYATQDIESVPEGFRGKLKRPDYLVGLPFVGNMAFDVKSKTIYEGCLLFDVDEVEKLTAFDDLFRISTFFACLDPSGGDRATWFRLPELKHCRTRRLKSGAVYVAPLSAGITVDMREPFQEALRATISLAL